MEIETKIGGSALAYLARVNGEKLIHAASALSLQSCSYVRTGGVMAITVVNPRVSELNNHASVSFGNPGFKINEYGLNAHEKIRRLRQRRDRTKAPEVKEIASSQSADGKTMHGGALVFTDKEGCEVYLSFSGAPAMVDEALMYVVGLQLGLIVPPTYQNQFIDEAMRLMS